MEPRDALECYREWMTIPLAWLDSPVSGKRPTQYDGTPRKRSTSISRVCVREVQTDMGIRSEKVLQGVWLVRVALPEDPKRGEAVVSA